MALVTSPKTVLAVGCLALCMIFASAGFSVFFAVIFTIREFVRESLSLAAAGLNVVNFFLFAALVALKEIFIRRRSSRRASKWRFALAILSALTALLAALSTLASLVWLQMQPANLNANPLRAHLRILVFVEFGLAGAALLLQAVFFLLYIVSAAGKRKRRRPLSVDGLGGGPETQQRTTLLFQDDKPPSPYLQQEASSTPTGSVYSDDTRTPTRSLSQDGSKSASSRTRMVHASQKGQGANTVGFSAMKAHGDENQGLGIQSSSDQSSVASKPRSTSNAAKRLEPIPGSRPNSPGRALDGPFPADANAARDGTAQSRRSSSRGVSPSDLKTSDEQEAPWPLPEPRGSGANSPSVVDESHIHPLFRTDSPMPPPTPTPGTTVTGVGIGGIFRARSFSRASSASGAASPTAPGWTSPLIRSRSGSQTVLAASRSSVVLPAGAQDQPRETRSLEALKSKSALSATHEVPPLP